MSTIDLTSDEFSFNAKREIHSLGEYWECFKKFDKEYFENLSYLENRFLKLPKGKGIQEI